MSYACCIYSIHASWTGFNINITVNHITSLILQTQLQESRVSVCFSMISGTVRNNRSSRFYIICSRIPVCSWKTTTANYMFTLVARTDKVKNTNRSKEAMRLWMVRHRSFLQSSLITSEWFQIRILWITDPRREETQVAPTRVKHIVACHGICIKPSEHQ